MDKYTTRVKIFVKEKVLSITKVEVQRFKNYTTRIPAGAGG
jgi:hypothetical protein